MQSCIVITKRRMVSIHELGFKNVGGSAGLQLSVFALIDYRYTSKRKKGHDEPDSGEVSYDQQQKCPPSNDTILLMV